MRCEKYLKQFQHSFFKVVILAVLYKIIFAVNAFPDAKWQWIEPFPSGNFLRSVFFLNESTGFAAGNQGTIIKTTDSGMRWHLLNPNSIRDLYEIFFRNAQTGYAVGKSGTILMTTDGGVIWTDKSNLIPQDLHDICFTSDNTGFAAGINGVIIKSTDSGNNWFQISSGTNAPLFCVDFLNDNTGVAAGYNIILKTSNSGINWVIQNAGVVTSSSVAGIAITGSSIFAAGNSPGGVLYKTTNGGVNWTSIPLGLDYLFNGSVDLVRSIDFINENTGYIVTDFGTILKTTNAGLNFLCDTSFRPAYEKISVMYDLKILNSERAYISGSGGNIFASYNSGINWTTLSGNKKTLKGNFFLNENTGYAAGESGTILKTVNAGLNWIQDGSRTNKFLNSIFFVNETGFICGDSGIILKSANLSSRWLIQNSNTDEKLNSIFFVSKEIGFSAGGNESNSRGIILQTVNSGKKWFTVFDSSDFGILKSICFVNDNTGFVCGAGGNLLKTTNCGLSWNCDRISYEELQSISFSDQINGLICGDNGLALRTTNAGASWIQINTGIFKNLNFIKYCNVKNAIACGDDGTVISSADGGLHWIQEQKCTENKINSVVRFDNGSAAAFGEYGTIIKSEKKNYIMQSERKQAAGIPAAFLYQNYPNPFNPETVIKYKLSANCEVSLIVYDVLGNEVSVLVNEKQNAGEYSVEFNGNNLSSGIYFYKLHSGIFEETRKMVLIE